MTVLIEPPPVSARDVDCCGEAIGDSGVPSRANACPEMTPHRQRTIGNESEGATQGVLFDGERLIVLRYTRGTDGP